MGNGVHETKLVQAQKVRQTCTERWLGLFRYLLLTVFLPLSRHK